MKNITFIICQNLLKLCQFMNLLLLHINLITVVESRAKQAKGRAYFGFQSHFSESKISHTSHTLDDLYFWRILYTKTLIFCMLKAIKIYLDEKINGIEFIIGPISPSGSLFGPKLQNCIHATCLYYIHHKFLPQLISIGIARCKLFIKKNVEVLEQILKLKDIGIPALFLLSTEIYCISTFY